MKNVMHSAAGCYMTAWFVQRLSAVPLWFCCFSGDIYYSCVLLLHSNEPHTSLMFYWRALQNTVYQILCFWVSGKMESCSQGGACLCTYLVLSCLYGPPFVFLDVYSNVLAFLKGICFGNASINLNFKCQKGIPRHLCGFYNIQHAVSKYK